MLRTPVPEATIDEYGDPSSHEYEIRGPAQRRLGTSVHAVAKSSPMKSRAHGQLRKCVATSVSQHAAPAAWCRRPTGRSRTLFH